MGSQPISIQLRKNLQANLAGNCCGKILWQILVGNSCGKRRGKIQFKKESDWWKFSIWNRVMGSQPISIQLRKILRENLAENFCEILLQEILAGNSCGKLLRENPEGRRKSQFKKGSDWWKFSIWIRVMGSQPISIQLGKILQENLAGNLAGKSCGKILREGEKANLRKAVIGGNLAFGLG